ncbi:MAG: hypothetical protein SFW67_05240 [Myxococcaceae bacterium]|nr:hypothetical protein [Myxococcaceae bacterium]
MTPRLTALQRELIEAFFARSRGLFLTGGAVLAGYDFGHRTTDNLDLFGFADAGRKDAGVDPATVAWTLEQLKIASTAPLPGDAELIARLRALTLRTTAR